MAILLSVYTDQAFREIRLPIQNNSDYTIVLYKNVYGLKKDITLHLEVINEKWEFMENSEYSVFKGNKAYERKYLQDKDVLTVYTDSETISVVVKEVEQAFYSFRKFRIDHLKQIKIGKNAENDICYDYAGLVSREHAVMTKISEGWQIRNTSANGIYINSEFVKDVQELKFGDYISIIGLHIVYFGDMIAVDMLGDAVRVNSKLISYREKKDAVAPKEPAGHVQAAEPRILLHRAPRNILKIETAPLEIEPPPQLNKQRRQPMLMTIGPSFTMALPMMLGCVLMMSGRSSSGIAMYSGLIMSVSSAIIGVVWALANVHYEKKQEKEDELHRFEVYSRYLQEKSEEVKVRYENNTEAMRRMYESAEVCVSYLENTSKLWNRNVHHMDFLALRIGVGDLPFQVQIACAEKKFRLEEDSLEDKPRLIRENFQTLYDVPVCVNLLTNRLIGIVGGEYLQGAIEVVKNIATQVAANNCYTDVKMAFVYDGQDAANLKRWGFAKWLPHVWSEDKKIRYVASDKNEASDIFYEITKMLRHREETGSTKKEEIQKPYLILFLINPELMEGELISKYIFERQANYGLTTFILSDTVENLPNACEVIIENDEQFQGIYNVSAQKEKHTYEIGPIEETEVKAYMETQTVAKAEEEKA